MKFTKMQGAGNDFIVLDNRSDEIRENEYSALAARLCRRRLSIGADGLMIQRIETTAGIVVGQRIEEDLYCVRLNDPTAVETEIGIPWDGQILSVSYMELGDPGIPHAVLELPEWDTMPEDELRSLGAYIRSYAAFPKGANVTFRKRLGRDHVKAVTYARGVEDFTLACGTGAGATAAAMRLRGEIRDETLRLDFPGGELQVSLSVEEDAVCDIYLTGPTIVVAEGEYLGR